MASFNNGTNDEDDYLDGNTAALHIPEEVMKAIDQVTVQINHSLIHSAYIEA